MGRVSSGPLAGPLAAVLVTLGCRSQPAKAAVPDSVIMAQREASFNKNLAERDTSTQGKKPIARWVMPGTLTEISGLALTSDGRLLAHNDEQGRVTELDYRRGAVVKRFLVGSPPIRGDFEGITVTPNGIILLSSSGRLYEFAEGKDAAEVPYTVHDPHLAGECEFEGVAYEAASNSVVMACKNTRKKSLDGFLVLYRWKRTGGTESDRVTELKVPLKSLIGSNKWKTLHPTDLTIDPASGNYVMVAAPEEALIEITPKGEVVFARSLPGRHPQAEGVAITKDGVLIVGDEGGKKGAAVITLYHWP